MAFASSSTALTKPSTSLENALTAGVATANEVSHPGTSDHAVEESNADALLTRLGKILGTRSPTLLPTPPPGGCKDLVSDCAARRAKLPEYEQRYFCNPDTTKKNCVQTCFLCSDTRYNGLG